MNTYLIKASQTVFCEIQGRNIQERFNRSIKAASKAEAIEDLVESICDEQGKTYAQTEPSIKINQVIKIK